MKGANALASRYKVSHKVIGEILDCCRSIFSSIEMDEVVIFFFFLISFLFLKMKCLCFTLDTLLLLQLSCFFKIMIMKILLKKCQKVTATTQKLAF